MPPTVPLRLHPLEAREVPAAGLFADIVPGIWGSYPHNITPSGAKLFFAAETSLGNELYVTDGTAAGTKLVKDIRPGRVGSNPTRFETADSGVVYFQADDGTGQTWWKSDGTAAGTFKVPGMPAGFLTMEYTSVARNGVLYFSRIDSAAQTVQVWKTDGTAPVLLKDFGPTSNPSLDVQDGRVVITTYAPDGVSTQYLTDGTPGGTRAWQRMHFVRDSAGVYGELGFGIEVSPGHFVHRTVDWQGGLFKTALWGSDGMTASSAPFHVFDTPDGDASIGSPLVKLGGKVYFTVSDPATNNYELWATDGTTAGTAKVALPITGRIQANRFELYAGRLVFDSHDDAAGRNRYWQTDGTAAGTSLLPTPADMVGFPSLFGQTPAGPEAPNGLLVFRTDDGRFFKTDGTAAGTAWIDMTGLGASRHFVGSGLFQLDGAGRAFTERDPGGVYFKGSMFFQSQRDGDQRPELWKWDVAQAPTTPPPQLPIAPKVLGVTVNGGQTQRSSVTSLTVEFDRRVNLEDGAVTVRDSTGKAVLVYLENDVIDGKSVLVVSFGGKSVADGRYTLTIRAGKVTDAATGGALAADSTSAFHRLYGDLDGDGTYDRAVRIRVKELLGYQAGDPEYDAALDYDGNGKIDAVDELEAVRHWGRSV